MAIVGMAVSAIFVSVMAVFTNLYLIIPFYVKLFGMSMDDIITMCRTVNPAMENVTTMAVFGRLPFKLIKYGVTSLVTFIAYKRLSRVYKRNYKQIRGEYHEIYIGQRHYLVSSKYVEIWDTSDDGYAFQFFIDFEKRQIEVKPYDQK